MVRCPGESATSPRRQDGRSDRLAWRRRPGADRDVAAIEENRAAWLFTTAAGKRITPGILVSRWSKIQRAAGLRGVRIYDLRHTFASHAAMTEEALPMIGKLLGHASVQSTRYAHLDDTHLIGAAQRVSDVIGAMMSGTGVR